MAGHLPVKWLGKRVTVVWLERGGGSIEARVIDYNDGGLLVSVSREGEAAEGTSEGEEFPAPREVFIPWSSVRYAELLEPEPDLKI